MKNTNDNILVPIHKFNQRHNKFQKGSSFLKGGMGSRDISFSYISKRNLKMQFRGEAERKLEIIVI